MVKSMPMPDKSIRHYLAAGLVAGAVTAALPSLSQETPAERRAILDAERARQEQASAEAEQIQQRADAEAAEISRKLVDVGAERSQAEQRLQALEVEIAALEQALATRRRQFDQDRAAGEDALAALAAIGRNPPPAILFRAEEPLAAARAASLLSAAAPGLIARARAHADALRALAAREQALAQAKTDLQTTEVGLARQTDALTQLAAEKRKAVDRAARLAANAKARLEAIGRESAELDALIRALIKEAPKLLPRPKPKLAPAARSAPSRPDIAVRRNGALARLLTPVNGRLLAGFGQDGATRRASDGVTYVASPGAQVIAPADGAVIFTGPFRSYDNVVIIDAGDDVLLVLTGLNTVLPKQGERVAAGEPIGAMGGIVSPPPELFFQVWRKDQTINPQPLLNAR